MPSPRPPKQRTATFRISTPPKIGAAQLDEIRAVLGGWPVVDDRLRELFRDIYIEHRVFEEELEDAARPAELAASWEYIRHAALRLERAAGGFEESARHAAAVVELAAREVDRLKALRAPRKSHLALRQTIAFSSARITLALLDAGHAIAPPLLRRRSRDRRVMDALRIGLEAMGVAVPWDAKHPDRYYNLRPAAPQIPGVWPPD